MPTIKPTDSAEAAALPSEQPQAAAPAQSAQPQDPIAGGSYVRDPITGVLTLDTPSTKNT